MPDNDMEIIEQAVIDTNREIAAEAWDQEAVELDRTNDRTPESVGEGLEGQQEAEEGEEAEGEEGEGGEAGAAQAKPGDDGKPKPEEAAAAKPAGEKPEPEGRVPSGKLREANERARAAEAERDRIKGENATALAAATKRVDDLQAKFDGVLAALQRQQPVQPQPQQQKPDEPAIPDLFEDPKGFIEHLTKGFTSELSKRDQQMEALRVETSLQMAHAIHKESFDKAYEAVTKLDPRNPDDQMTVRRIYAAPNPGEALVQWHKRSETLRVVGDDPGKYKETLAAEIRQSLMTDPEFRKQVIEGLQAEALGGPNGKPNTSVRLPANLNGSPGGTRERVPADAFDGSPQAIADSAWR